MKRTIRLTESELKHIINESVRKIISQLPPPKGRGILAQV